VSTHLKGILLAVAGIILLSPDTLLVRLLDLPQWTLQFYRGVGVFVSLTAGIAFFYGRGVFKVFRATGKTGLVAGFGYTMASLLFVSSLYHTTVANTLAIISTAPIWGALMSRFLLKERLPLRTWVAILLSVGAIGIIVGGDVAAGREHLLGDLLALLQAVFMAASFVLVRSKAEVNMVPATAMGGVFMCFIAFPVADTLMVPPAQIPMLALLVLVVLPVPFGLLVLATRHVPAPEVNMVMLLEMILGPLLVWMFVGESVPPATIAGGGLLFAVLLAHSWLAERQRRRIVRGARLPREEVPLG
jgi:drug/metabolite transporter (DMT)-like permease